MDRVVLPFKPRFIVYYCGSNDVNGKEGATGIVERITQFNDRVHAVLPQTRVFFVAIQRAPDKRARWAVVDSVNAALKAAAARSSYISYIDLNPVLFDRTGAVRSELYKPDSLHFLPPAYVEFTAVIKPALEVTALIADPDMRTRDERFADRAHHTSAPDPLHDKSGTAKQVLPLLTPSDFTYDAAARTCVCPAGKSLNRRGARNVTNGYVGEHFQGAPRDCAPCALRAQCLRTPATTVVRNVAFFRGRDDTAETETHTMRMQQQLDTPAGREQYGQRFGTVEPVFGNLRYNKRRARFTRRGRTKVNGQWLLFCLVHNIETLTNNGYAA